MASSSDAVAAPTVRVFIAGGSYAGLSTAVNLLDLGKGLSPRMLQGKKYEHHADLPAVNWAITIVDERDGFCKTLMTSRNNTNKRETEMYFLSFLSDHLY